MDKRVVKQGEKDDTSAGLITADQGAMKGSFLLALQIKPAKYVEVAPGRKCLTAMWSHVKEVVELLFRHCSWDSMDNFKRWYYL